MADRLRPELRNELQGIRFLLWGSYVNPDIFKRWSQGFQFSLYESSALEQKDGGPCAVIAPVQAFILKTILNQSQESMFASITKEKQDYLLVTALCDILSQCNSPIFKIVNLKPNFNQRHENTVEERSPVHQHSDDSNSQDAFQLHKVARLESPEPENSKTTFVNKVQLKLKEVDNKETENVVNQNMELVDFNKSLENVNMDVLPSDIRQCEETCTVVKLTNSLDSEPVKLQTSTVLEPMPHVSEALEINRISPNPDQLVDRNPGFSENTYLNSPTRLPADILEEEIEDYLTPEMFHDHLRVIEFNSIDEVEKYLKTNIDYLKCEYGVLLFLYSMILTKGLEQVKQELSDTSEPLIHETYGYGSQGLINLMLTGRCVGYVWDNEQDIGGLKLKGIDKQSQVGFITLMEHMRYCTVGSFYKNPRFPVWVMGSETHLTVLFSFEKRLVSPETPSETARRVFKSYDPDGNNFISSVLLQDVLQALGLVSEPEYVDIMKKKLDAENLGIILMNAFLDEFYPNDKSSTPDTFTLWHYNGLARSNADNKVLYTKGHAILLECDLKSICESNPMLTCLQTKWPNIEVNWISRRTPSLN